MSTEYRHVSFCFDATTFIGTGEPNSASIQTINLASSLPAVAEHLDGWEVISHQLLPAGNVVFLSLMLRLVVDPPADLAELDS